MQNKITQAVILSAGFGARLRPLTDAMPKVMAPLLGKPLLEHHIAHLQKHGVTEVFINLHYLPDVITDYFGDGAEWDVKIAYARETPDILGTAGGVKNFDGMLRGNFFVIYGDVFSLVDYSKMAEAFAAKPGAIGMEVVGDTDHPHDSDLAEVDDGLRFIKIYPKPNATPPLRYKSMRALFIFNERILTLIPPKQYYEIDHQLLPDVLAKGEKFYGYECGEFLKDAGTMERYGKVKEHIEAMAGRGEYSI